jgi:hypothetical protein
MHIGLAIPCAHGHMNSICKLAWYCLGAVWSLTKSPCFLWMGPAIPKSNHSDHKTWLLGTPKEADQIQQYLQDTSSKQGGAAFQIVVQEA